jgi:methyl-CpG-binding domain protein 4
MSPFELLQEIYISDPWKSLVCCILLNCTKRKQVDQVRTELFKRYRTARAMASANPIELAELLQPLGFQNKRAMTLIRFSDEWSGKKWHHPRELYGIGEYAAASWDIFYEHEYTVNPNDGVLVQYLNWKKEQIKNGK